MNFLVILYFLFILGLTQAEDNGVSSARLLIEKKILNKYLVESRDLIVHYSIFNVGESPAVDAHINDVSLPEEYFERLSGLDHFYIPRLGPGQNISHTVVYRPKPGVWGKFNFTAAQVSYLAREDLKEVKYGSTSEPGEGYIISLKDFDRKFSPHVLDWIAFSVMSLPSLIIPLYLWYRSKSKYEAIVSKQSKKH